MNEVKEELGFARKGNGITVYNKAMEVNGDYVNVAHISDNGKITWYVNQMPKKFMKQIKTMASAQKFKKESVNEEKAKVWKSNDRLYVDSDFVNFSKGKLKNSELKHAGMGDFYLQTSNGNINFSRVSGKFDGMSGRGHQMDGDKKLVALLIKKMGAKIVNESLNEASQSYSKPNAEAKKKLKGMLKLPAKQFHQMNNFIYYDKKTKKWWFVDFEGDLMELKNNYYLKQINDYILKNQININESINESISQSEKYKVYNGLKKGDELEIDRKDGFKTYVVIKGKATVGKQKVERITLINKSNPKGVKFYLYNRNKNIGLAIGDGASPIKDMKLSNNESITESDKADTAFGKILFKIKKDEGEFDLYNAVQDAAVGGNVKSVISVLKDYDVYSDYKKYLKGITELNEAVEPEIIQNLRWIVKNGYKNIKDPKTGKKMKVDSYTASAIILVYDSINNTNKKKYAEQGLMKMSNIAFKMMK